MRMKSKIGDSMFITILILSVLTLLFFVVWAVLGVWIPVLVMMLLLVLIVGPVYFFTYYDIDKDALKINCGIFLINYKIDYHNIISMTDVEKFTFAPALSFNRICIRYVKNGKIKSILISPANKDKFRELVHAQIKESMDRAQNTPNTADESMIQQVLEKERMEQAKRESKELRRQAKIAEKERRISEKEIALLAKRAKQAEKNDEVEAMKNAVDNANKDIAESALAAQDTSSKKEARKLYKQQQALEKKQAKERAKQERENAKALARQLAQEEKLADQRIKEQEQLEEKQLDESIEKQEKLEKEQQEQQEKLQLSEQELANVFATTAEPDTAQIKLDVVDTDQASIEKSNTSDNNANDTEIVQNNQDGNITKRGRGRPAGSKNKSTKEKAQTSTPKKRGRPAGSKNKNTKK